jgi:hypothetical protein
MQVCNMIRQQMYHTKIGLLLPVVTWIRCRYVETHVFTTRVDSVHESRRSTEPKKSLQNSMDSSRKVNDAILDSLSNLEQSDDSILVLLLVCVPRCYALIVWSVSVVFMKNIMYKTKRTTETLQSEDLNVIDAITIVESTVKNLRKCQ